MKNATTFLAALSIIYICIITGKSSRSSALVVPPNECLAAVDQIHALNVPNQGISVESPLLLDDASSSLEQYDALIDDEYPKRVNPLFSHRRSDSAEKYFDWASKTQRKSNMDVPFSDRPSSYCFSLGPMEYFRGKRYWLFTKKNEHGLGVEQVPSPHSVSNSLSQGIWRSGIVGRRRR